MPTHKGCAGNDGKPKWILSSQRRGIVETLAIPRARWQRSPDVRFDVGAMGMPCVGLWTMEEGNRESSVNWHQLSKYVTRLKMYIHWVAHAKSNLPSGTAIVRLSHDVHKQQLEQSSNRYIKLNPCFKRRYYYIFSAYGFIDNKTSLHYHYKCRYKILESSSMR